MWRRCMFLLLYFRQDLYHFRFPVVLEAYSRFCLPPPRRIAETGLHQLLYLGDDWQLRWSAVKGVAFCAAIDWGYLVAFGATVSPRIWHVKSQLLVWSKLQLWTPDMITRMVNCEWKTRQQWQIHQSERLSDGTSEMHRSRPVAVQYSVYKPDGSMILFMQYSPKNAMISGPSTPIRRPFLRMYQNEC